MILRLLFPLKPFGLFREWNQFRFREHDNHEFQDMGLCFACVWCGKILNAAREENRPAKWCPYP